MVNPRKKANPYTSIRVTTETRERLVRLSTKDDTFDAIIRKLLDSIKK